MIKLKQFILFAIAFLVAINSNAITKEEFNKYVFSEADKAVFLALTYGNYILEKNGSLTYTFYDIKRISYDGASADVKLICSVSGGSWRFENGKVRIKVGTIVKCSSELKNTSIGMVEGQYQGLKQIAKNLERDYTSETSERKGKTYLCEPCIERKGTLHEDYNEEPWVYGSISCLMTVGDELCSCPIIHRRMSVSEAAEWGITVNSSSSSSSGSSSYQNDEPKYIPPTRVEYPDGNQSIVNFVQKNLVYPTDYDQDGINVDYEYELKVNTTGDVTNVKCMTDNTLTRRTVNLLKGLPRKFTPATNNGQNITGTYYVTIHYNRQPAIKVDNTKFQLNWRGGEIAIQVTPRSGEYWDYESPLSSVAEFRKEGNMLYARFHERGPHDYDERKGTVTIYNIARTTAKEIIVSQAGHPFPRITPERTRITFPREGGIINIPITSNCDWIYSYSGSKNISIQRDNNTLKTSARKNFKKDGLSGAVTLSADNGDGANTITLYQKSRKDEWQEKRTQSTNDGSSCVGKYCDFYDEYEKYSLGLNLSAGLGYELHGGIYGHLNLDVLPFRVHFVEVSLFNGRFDFSLDDLDLFKSFSLEPQVKFLVPMSTDWIFIPYIGPTWQIASGHIYTGRELDLNDYKEIKMNIYSNWSYSGGLIIRKYLDTYDYLDINIGYHGGEVSRGISLGISYGLSWGLSRRK